MYLKIAFLVHSDFCFLCFGGVLNNMLEVSVDGLKKVVEDFYNITKIKIVLYDDNRNIIYSYPKGMCEFCDNIRANKELAKKCIDCDNIGFDVCDNTKKPYIYKCHMSLCEAIAPICENNIIIGYMMLGQILGDGDYDNVIKRIDCVAKKHSVNKGLLKKCLASFKSVDDDYIGSIVNMMSMCACYLYNNRIIQKNTDVFVFQLKDYIENHISDDLSVTELCKKMYISKTKLYHISNKNFNMGITDYIRKKRIEKAKKMLKNSNKPISAISDEVGFRDANYFSRIFKHYENMTPMQYRKLYIP